MLCIFIITCLCAIQVSINEMESISAASISEAVNTSGFSPSEVISIVIQSGKLEQSELADGEKKLVTTYDNLKIFDMRGDSFQGKYSQTAALSRLT